MSDPWEQLQADYAAAVQDMEQARERVKATRKAMDEHLEMVRAGEQLGMDLFSLADEDRAVMLKLLALRNQRAADDGGVTAQINTVSVGANNNV